MKTALIVDVDEVILDTYAGFVKCLVDKFGDKDHYRIMNQDWEMGKVLSEEELAYLWGADGYKGLAFHESLKLKEGAYETLTDLIPFFDITMILTDAPVEVQTYRRKLMNQYFPTAQLHFTHHKSAKSESEAMSKADTVNFLFRDDGTSVTVIEDAPHHVEEMMVLDCVERIFMFDMPYNQHIKGMKVDRVQSWSDIAKKTERILV